MGAFRENRKSIAWTNSRGANGPEGVIAIRYVSSGGHYGTMSIPEIFVPVLPGRNLIYRLHYLRKVAGDCELSATPFITEEAVSDFFFVESR